MQIRKLRPDLDIMRLPSLDEMMKSEITPYPLPSTFEELENVTSFIIHSSGTTGTSEPNVDKRDGH